MYLCTHVCMCVCMYVGMYCLYLRSYVCIYVCIGYFEATRGYVIYLPRVYPEANESLIPPRGLKITSIYMHIHGSVGVIIYVDIYFWFNEEMGKRQLLKLHRRVHVS